MERRELEAGRRRSGPGQQRRGLGLERHELDAGRGLTEGRRDEAPARHMDIVYRRWVDLLP